MDRSSGQRAFVRQTAGGGSEETEEKTHVAVGKAVKENITNLAWVLQNTPRDQKIVLVHVHRPAPTTTSIMTGFFDVHRLAEQLNAYEHSPRLQIDKFRKDYSELRNTNLVIYKYLDVCAAYKFHAKTLLIVSDDVAKGLVDLIARHRITSLVMGAAAGKHYSTEMKVPRSRTALTVQEQADPSCNITFLCNGNLICTRNVPFNYVSGSLPLEFEPKVLETYSIQEQLRQDVGKLQKERDEAVKEAEHLRKEKEEFEAKVSEAYLIQERLRQDVEMFRQEKDEAVKEAEELRKEEEEFEAKVLEAYSIQERLRQDVEMFQQERNEAVKVAEELRKEKEEFEAKVLEAYSIQERLRQYVEMFQKERDEAVKEAEELRKEKEETTSSTQARVAFSEFTYSELEEATNNFDKSLMIGEGGYGKVYKGFLRHTVVAIKMLNPQGVQGEVEFNQEVDILSRVRHPNLVTLIGACPEVQALVYEFLPNKSLEDWLKMKDPRRALTWQARMQIAGEICAALIFLHSTKPQCIVHGDLKPDNILLDANYVSKLGDFGICRLLDQSSTAMTAYHQTDAPKGTLAYMDPEYLSSGELTLQSDVYSFGIVLLRLITGKGPLKIRNAVQEALQKGCLKELLDTSVGEWPFEVEAEELANLGVRYCNPERTKRPELAEVWRMLEPMMNYVPSYLICPITKKIMEDPHIAADGFTYEAEAIKRWFRSGHNTSPVTKLRLPTYKLIRNHAIHSAIQEWLQKQQ